MQNSKEYGGTNQPEEIGGEEGAAQQLKRILANGLPPLYRVAYRILGNAPDAEDALQDALLAAYTHRRIQRRTATGFRLGAAGGSAA